MAMAGVLGLVALQAEAAYISELFIDDGGAREVPHAVEFDALGRLEADHAELLVVDAGPSALGHLQRVIGVPTDRPLRMLSERPWPEQVWDMQVNTHAAHTTLAELGETDGFHFNAARTLLLYDRPTGLTQTLAESVFSPSVQDRLAEAELLEALTLVFPGGVADAEAPGPHFTLEPGDALVRPLDEAGEPRPELVIGTTTDTGTLAGTDPRLSLSPAARNPEWRPVPEPGTAALALGLAITALMMRHRGGHCSHRRPGL